MKDDELILLQKIGSRIRAARAMAGFSQEYLAQRSGLKRVSVSNIEAGRNGTTIGKLAALARALHLSLDDLVEESDTPRYQARHAVTITRTLKFEVTCLTCQLVIGVAGSYEEAVESRRDHKEREWEKDAAQG